MDELRGLDRDLVLKACEAAKPSLKLGDMSKIMQHLSPSESRRADEESDESESETTRSRTKRREVKALQKRIRYLTQSPLDRLVVGMDRLTAPADWPFDGTPCEERVAPFWLPHAAKGGTRLKAYSIELRTRKRAMACKALEVHTFICGVLDELILYDNMDVINSAGVEMLVRRCYALEKAFELVDEEKDWKGDPKKLKVNWGALEEYDVLCAGAGAIAPRADEMVRKANERKATTAKWAAKRAQHGPADA